MKQPDNYVSGCFGYCCENLNIVVVWNGVSGSSVVLLSAHSGWLGESG